MSRSIQLDTNALIALADPAGAVVQLVRERVQEGRLPAASAVAWHEFVRGPLLPDELLRVERVVGARIQPVTRGTAELAARLFNATGRRAFTADCFIAASAIESGAELLTANREDFNPFVPFGLQLAAAG
ncbi:MAG TPA: PIN domain-containing protein [Chthoniobacterales bacterium]